MQVEERRALSAVRLETAQDCLDTAKAMLSLEKYKGAANRCYYAVFHAMRAVLALREIDMKHHSGIISEFRRHYVKTGIFDSRMSDIINEVYDIRTDSDYNDFYVISKSEVTEQVGNAEYFLAEVKKYLSNLDKIE